MTWYDKMTYAMGLGLFYGLKFEWLSLKFNNMTVGIHGQEWDAEYEVAGNTVKLNELYIGVLFFRFIIEFIVPNETTN